MGDPGKLVVAIPTGYGTNGVRKEALEILLRLATEMSIDGVVNKRWGSYYKPDNDNPRWYHNKLWGMIVSTEVGDLERSRLIMQDFGFDLGDIPHFNDFYKPHIRLNNPFVRVIDEP